MTSSPPSLFADPPAGVRVDHPGQPVWRADLDDAGRLVSFATPMGPEPGELLSGTVDADITWEARPFGLRGTVLSDRAGSVTVPLACVESVHDDRDLALPAPVTGQRLLALHHWVRRQDLGGLAPDGERKRADHVVDVSYRRVLCLSGPAASVLTPTAWVIPLAAGTTTFELTVRWPLVSEQDHYPTSTGSQAWRTVRPPDVDDSPRPLFVGLHGACNTADNYLLCSHPTPGASAKLVAPMLLGATLVIPNANDATRVEAPDEGRLPVPTMYGAEQERHVLDAVDEASRRWPVDRSRVYLSGISMGGHGALSLAARHPDRFAAAIATVPITDLPALHKRARRSPLGWLLVAELARGAGQPYRQDPQAYRQLSALHLAANLEQTVVVFGGAVGDRIVPGRSQVAPFQGRLDELGIAHTSMLHDGGHHIDHVTVESTYAAALQQLLRRPGVAPRPERIRYRTSDLRWPGAWWLRVLELSGRGFGDVTAEIVGADLVLELTGVRRLQVDRTEPVIGHADPECVVVDPEGRVLAVLTPV